MVWVTKYTYLRQLASSPDQTLPKNTELLNGQICCTLHFSISTVTHTGGERNRERINYTVQFLDQCHEWWVSTSPRPEFTSSLGCGSPTQVAVLEQWHHPRRETGGHTEADGLHTSPAKETFSISRVTCPEVHQCLFITQFFVVVVKILLYKSVSHRWGWMTPYIAYCTDIFCSFCVLL